MYSYYIHDFGSSKQKKHWFDSFEEYWEYRRLEANRIDANLVLSSTDKSCSLFIRTDYSRRYYEDENEYKQWIKMLDEFIEIEYIVAGNNTFRKRNKQSSGVLFIGRNTGMLIYKNNK